MDKPMKMKHCAYCGDELGLVAHDSYFREPEPCGKRECQREVTAMYRDEREQAHEQLDRDMGWY